MRLTKILRTALTVTLAAVATPLIDGLPAQAATPLFQLPFPCGQSWVEAPGPTTRPSWRST